MYDRALAPQKGAELEVTLTGYIEMQHPLTPSFPTKVKKEYSQYVIGTRYYRDRE